MATIFTLVAIVRQTEYAKFQFPASSPIMTRLALTLLTFTLTAIAFGQNHFSGEYVTNFPTYGMFSKTLIVNCDGTAVLNFQGDLMNDNSYGRWVIQNGTLTVFFDTTNPNARYKDTLSFKIKGKRLYMKGWTKDTFHKYKAMIEQHNMKTGENLQLPSYKEFDQNYNRIPKNFQGKTGIQYFKKSKTYSCDKTQVAHRNILPSDGMEEEN